MLCAKLESSQLKSLILRFMPLSSLMAVRLQYTKNNVEFSEIEIINTVGKSGIAKCARFAHLRFTQHFISSFGEHKGSSRRAG